MNINQYAAAQINGTYVLKSVQTFFSSQGDLELYFIVTGLNLTLLKINKLCKVGNLFEKGSDFYSSFSSFNLLVLNIFNWNKNNIWKNNMFLISLLVNCVPFYGSLYIFTILIMFTFTIGLHEECLAPMISVHTIKQDMWVSIAS